MLPYTTQDFQHPDTGVPCVFEWDAESQRLTMRPCNTLIALWSLEEENPEAVEETKVACIQFGTHYCEDLEDANEYIRQTRYYDNGENMFCLD